MQYEDHGAFKILQVLNADVKAGTFDLRVRSSGLVSSATILSQKRRDCRTLNIRGLSRNLFRASRVL